VASRRGLIGPTVLVFASSALGAAYLAAGHQFVAHAYARGTGAVLRNILAGEGPFTLSDYLAASDALVWGAVVLGWLLAAVLFAGRYADPVMARVYRAILAAADWAGGHSRTVGAVAAIVVAGGLAWVAVDVLQRFPNSGDEYCYLYQAETFARGRVANTPHPLQEFFGFYHVRQVENRLFSVFPPGWPAVLSVALALRVPTWLVNPLLGTVLLWLTWLVGRRVADERAAVVAAGIVALSPFFVFNSASFFAHTFCGVLVLAYAYAGLRALDEGHAAWAVAAGAVLGAAFLTRNYTAVWCAVPFAVALARRGRFGWMSLMACAAAGLPFVLLSLWYNAATMGAPFASAAGGEFQAYDDHWFPAGWFSRAFEITGDHLVNFVQWTPPGLLALYAWYWVSVPGKSRRRFTDFIFPALVLGYFIYVNRGGNRYGPRYYFEAFPFVVLAVTARVMQHPRYEDKSAGERRAFYLMAVSVVACLPMLAWHARVESAIVAERNEPYRLAAEQRIDHAIVFVAGRAGWTRPMSERDLTRNGPDFTDAVLYVHDRGPDNDRLMAVYPERSYWRYRFDRRTRQGRLESLRPMVR
jgi:hypothetical protein